VELFSHLLILNHAFLNLDFLSCHVEKFECELNYKISKISKMISIHLNDNLRNHIKSI